MSIRNSILDIILQHDSSQVAIVYGNKSWTYTELSERCLWWKEHLTNKVSQGEIVVCDFESDPFEYICKFIGVVSAGGIHLSTRDRYTTWSRLQRLGTPWSAITSLSDAGVLTEFSSLRTAINKHDGNIFLKNELPESSLYSSGRILETSGSTGEPKWVYWTEYNLIQDRKSWINDLSLNLQDSILNLHALDFAHGIDVHVLPALFIGITVVHHNIRSDDVTDIINSISKHNVTMMSALPSHYTYLAINSTDPNLGNNVRWALTGGALLSPVTISMIQNKAGLKLKRLYGATEAGIMCADLEKDNQSIPTLWPMNGIEMKVRPLKAVSDKFPNIGEPYFKRTHMASLYWGDEVRTESTFGDGWYKTGDAVSINDDGSIAVLGRAEDVWFDNTTQKLQSAGEISSAISEIHGINEVAVFPPSTPSAKPTIFCTIDPQISISTLNEYITEKLDQLLIEATIFLGNDWPRTIVGKPARRALLAWTTE
ncbi:MULTISPECIES: ANL family adenylate-forming protein [Acinetobacter]|jgi:acyl-coenzyme A synthetase/AMP-(fatty) acid ligase|uniref:Long-chain fatty acid--CoA ligase n=1 Tax=Acinetobacter indicus TaxID=756892 RepID=A0A6C0Y6T7_9GAMM|nr:MULTISPECIES: fatty acid--CoA ligase family protein [Acinetobacter]MDV2488904.1 fatty acid--CoA ligase family protein [Acinetobacter johnsonii]QIC71820.1 long-chain fatty acid--CoA ligase [Acinetobacter indicus]QKQ71356.1 long-chain fatty acid--CoA ligase [Acinetobacter sp. 10FS3-1]